MSCGTWPLCDFVEQREEQNNTQKHFCEAFLWVKYKWQTGCKGDVVVFVNPSGRLLQTHVVEPWSRYDQEKPSLPPTNESFYMQPPDYLKPWQQQVSALVSKLERPLLCVRGTAGRYPGQNQGKSERTRSYNMFITAVARMLCIYYGAASQLCLTRSSLSPENVLLLQSIQQKRIIVFGSSRVPQTSFYCIITRLSGTLTAGLFSNCNKCSEDPNL